MGLSVLCLGLELCDFLLDLLLYTSLQLWAVAEHEQHLKPDKHGSQEESLGKVVKKSGGTALKGAVANELHDPADEMESQCALEGRLRVLTAQVVAKGSAAHAESGEDEASKGLQEQVERGIDKSSNCAKVEIKVGNGEPRWGLDESSGVCGLREVVRIRDMLGVLRISAGPGGGFMRGKTNHGKGRDQN